MRSVHRGASGHQGLGTLNPSGCTVTGLTPAFHFLLCIETMAKHLAFHLAVQLILSSDWHHRCNNLKLSLHTNSALQRESWLPLPFYSPLIQTIWADSIRWRDGGHGMRGGHVLPAVSQGLLIPGRGHYTGADKIPAISLYTSPSLIRLCTTLACASLCNCLSNQN